ncbi:hypothetical protein [Pantoea anthophila]|uniref:hypothetical protein n=1 Tax=Pantoea anthophila TaxID=470931 RepID=UPI003CE79B9D
MFGRIVLTTKSLLSLQLDTSNPRLLGYKKQGKLKTEKEIITLMMTRYGVRELVNSILSNGFYPDEILYAIPCELMPNKRIIVEGNRRLTACKVIRKPSILKGTPFANFINKIQSHPNYEYAVETIKKLHIVELSSRSEARTYIASKHTKESIKRWSVYTQGAYYIDLLEEFPDINALRASISNSVPSSRIKGVILFTRITDQILSLPTLSNEEKESLLNDIDNIKTEAIFRLIQRLDFKEEIANISLNKEGDIIVRKIGITAYNHVLAKLARDANFTKKLSTRQENDKEIREYLEQLKDIVNRFASPLEKFDDHEDFDDELTLNLEEEDTEEKDDLEKKEDETRDISTTITTLKPTVKVVSRKPPNTLLRKEDFVVTNHAKIDDLIYEATTLNVLKHKHSAILLSRTIIQVVLAHIMKNSEQHEKYMLESKRKHEYLELDSLLNYFCNNLKNIFPNEVDESIYKLMRSDLLSYKDTGKLISNLVTHNDKHALTLQEVTHVQVKLQSMMGYFLNKLSTGHQCTIHV